MAGGTRMAPRPRWRARRLRAVLGTHGGCDSHGAASSVAHTTASRRPSMVRFPRESGSFRWDRHACRGLDENRRWNRRLSLRSRGGGSAVSHPFRGEAHLVQARAVPALPPDPSRPCSPGSPAAFYHILRTVPDGTRGPRVASVVIWYDNFLVLTNDDAVWAKALRGRSTRL
jgi:hypothetical protein